MRVHLEIGDTGGEIQGPAEVLQRHVERNVDEVLLGGGERAREVEERADAEVRVEGLAARAGNGLGGLVADGGAHGTSLEAHEEDGGDGGGDD